MNPNCYVDVAAHEMHRLKSLAEGAMAQLDDLQWFASPGGDGNSVAVLVKHLTGNLRSRWHSFLTSDGEKPDRDRDAEFVTEGDTRASLMKDWEAAWGELFVTLSGLEDRDLVSVVTIRGEPHTVLQAIGRQQSHYAYHVGQIVFQAKGLAGDRWKTLSVPRGESRAWNTRSGRYLKDDQARD